MSRSSSGASFSQITTFREFLLLSAAFCFLVLAPFLPLSSCWAASSVNVPLDHWAYSALDKLDGFGLIHSDIQGTRPFSRNEFGRTHPGGIDRERTAPHGSSFPPDLSIGKLQREFHRELSSLQSGDGRSAPSRTQASAGSARPLRVHGRRTPSLPRIRKGLQGDECHGRHPHGLQQRRDYLLPTP